jgi:hypothetical protein
MSLRRDEMSNTKMFLAAAHVVLNLVQGGAELRVDVLDLEITALKQEQTVPTPAVDYRAQAQAIAKDERIEMVTLTHGAVWGNSDPAPYVNVVLAEMEQEKKFMEGMKGLAEAIDGVREGTEKLLESKDGEPAKDGVVEPITDPKDRDNQVEDPKLTELREIQKQERDSAEYMTGQRREKLDERLADADPEVRQAHLNKFDKVAQEAADQMATKHAAQLKDFKPPPSGPPPPAPSPLER